MLNMFFAVPCEPYAIDPVAAEALDLLFILHADHEQNASTSTVRLAGSTGANPYAAISAGVSALWGPAHGGANEAVLDMLDGIGSVANIDKFLARVKDKNDSVRLMGFGHRVYKNFDPRAKIIRGMCYRVLEKLGRADNPLFDLALQAGGDRAQGRVLRVAQALSERRLLLRHHLQRARHPALHVHGHVRDRAHRRLGGALAGNGLRSAHENRPSTPALHRSHQARLSADRKALIDAGARECMPDCAHRARCRSCIGARLPRAAATGRRDRAAAPLCPKRISAPTRADPVALGSAQWNGWGRDLDNTRYQPEPAIRAIDVPKLALKWAFGYQGGTVIRPAHGGRRPVVRREFRRPRVCAGCQDRLHLLDL